ncbi:unnamed protein product [Adineta ricciae]|uniref:Uncharacterized protein n=1 Tax=Adineta ricciae TaxID=249248 RepID=A0A815MP09_ADIRI|nr:unnamed protein product [Adineta ricciae]CAF1425890.1 unnamed protein product [Adineta ricciae]
MNLRTLSKRYLHQTRISLSELNFFSTEEDEDTHELHNQTLSTRIYLILLVVSVFGLLIYTLTVPITETIVIKQPFYHQYQKLIYEQHNLQCQCKQTSITFDEFVDLQPHYHPVCTSDFISDQWLDFLSNISQLPHLSVIDFRRTAVYSFQFLQHLCKFAETNIDQFVQQQFKSRSYISYHLKGNDIFQEEIRSYVDKLIETEEVNFVQLIRIFSDFIHSQGLVSTLSTNIVHYRNIPSVVTSDVENLLTYYRDRKYYDKKTHTNCRCFFFKCIQEYEIRDLQTSSILFTIPNFYTGCFIVDSLLDSSLICFYNQTCIKELTFHLNSSLSITTINLSRSFSKINQTVYELASHLMINEWNTTTYFHKYYDLCQPFQCIYTYEHRFVISYVITTLWSAIGGLVTIFRVLVPNVVKLIRKRRNDTNEKISKRRWLVGQLKSVNLFKSTPPSTDFEVVYLEIISTYIYIFVFLVSLILLTIYTAVLPQKVTITVSSPSIKEYEHLNVHHADTLTCECTQISIDLQTFIEITPKYHQICSSVYITDIWYQYLISRAENVSSGILYTADDFPTAIGPAVFRMLEAFCKLSQENVQTKLNNLKLSTYITKEVVRRTVFVAQQSHTVELFKLDQHLTNALSMEMFAEMIQWNSLYSYMQINYSPYLRYPPWSVHMGFSYADKCLCILQYRRCFIPATIAALEPNKTSVYGSFWPVPGIFGGCYPYFGTLPSTLVCLYNKSCLSGLIYYLRPTFELNITVLKEHSPPSIFNSTTRIIELIQESMIEHWQIIISYEQYYEKCKPKQCTYTYVKRFLITYVISIILGVIGGLSWSLRLIVPYSVKLIRKLWIKIRYEDDQNQDDISTFTTYLKVLFLHIT